MGDKLRYWNKVIWSGDVVELIEYELSVVVGREVNRLGRSVEASKEQKVLNRLKTMRRARSNLMRLINSNVRRWYDEDGRPYEPVFLTLTFANNVQDIDEGNKAFKNFRRRLEYEINVKLKYVCVVEFQKRGAIHYHLVIFNLPYLPAASIERIWRHGFIKINVIYDVDNVGAYMAKYMGKDVTDERLIGEKCYFSSRGLHKPKEKALTKKEIDQLAAGLSGKEVYKVEYESEYTGKTVYTQYNLKRQQIPQKLYGTVF